MAKGHKTGGRKRGTSNKATQQRRNLIDAATKEGITPLEHMSKIMRDENESPERRDEMAKAAAPFVHPRLQAIQHTGEDGQGPVQIERIERVIIDPAAVDGDGR